MTFVLKTPHDYEILQLHLPRTLDSIDGERRASLYTVVSDAWSDAERAEFGVYEVNTNPPAGSRWTGNFVTVEGVPQAEFVPVTFAERKEAKRKAVKAVQERRFAAGWTHDFGAAGVHTLDMRNADDKGNWTLLLIKTQGMIAAGVMDAPVSIRTADNLHISVSANAAHAAMNKFLAWGEDMLKRKWVLDDEIDAAADEVELDAIDIEVGWPE